MFEQKINSGPGREYFETLGLDASRMHTVSSHSNSDIPTAIHARCKGYKVPNDNY